MATLTNQISLKSGDGLFYSIVSTPSLSSLSDLSQYTNVKNVKTLLSRNTIYPRFRIFVLNSDETIRYQIPNEDILAGGSYSENYQTGSRRTLSFSLYNDEGKYTPSINTFWSGTKFSLEMGIEVPDQNIIIWFKKGVFVMTNARPSHTAENKTVSIECADKFSIFESKWATIAETTEIPTESVIKDLFIDTLATSMGNGIPLDTKSIRYDPSFEGRKTGATISLSAGSTWSSLLTQLATLLSAEMFYDAEGHLVITPSVETMSDGAKPVLYDYNKATMQNDDINLDMDNFVNGVYVMGATVNGHTAIAKSTNDDPKSPLSVSRIGLRLGDTVNDSNITTDILAQERADYELRRQTIMKTSISSSVFFNPLLTVNNIVTYTDDFYDFKRERFLIQSVSCSLGYDGLMSLTVSNINNLPFVFS